MHPAVPTVTLTTTFERTLAVAPTGVVGVPVSLTVTVGALV